MDNYSESNFCPRLLDYVVIIGSRSPKADQRVTRPLMLRR